MASIRGISRSLPGFKSPYARSGVYGFSRSLDRTSTIIFNKRPISQQATKSPEELPCRDGAIEQSSSSKLNDFLDFQHTNAEVVGGPRSSLRLTTPFLLNSAYKKPRYFPLHWLRDACKCNLCVDPDSGQKNFGTCDVPMNPLIEEIIPTEDGGMKIVWKDDFLTSGRHVSLYWPSDLDTASAGSKRKPKLPNITLWDAATLKRDRLTVDFNDWMAGGQEFLSGLHRLHTHGLLFLRNVPASEQSVVSIANQIGNLQETFYGRTWDVRSKPNAENVAYTSSFLGLHQDLLYVHDPPRIQLLHCLENTCEGGESMFSDGARVSHMIRSEAHTDYKALSKRQLRYHYIKQGHHYEMLRPVLPENPDLVFWSPPFQASRQTLTVEESEDISGEYFTWLRAATLFKNLLEEDRWMYQYKMQPGECVLFDNLRVLHGRGKFDTLTGSRWLKGAYIAGDVFESKLATLSPQLIELSQGNEMSPPKQAIQMRESYGM